MKRRGISLLLILVLCTGLTIPALAGGSTHTFTTDCLDVNTKGGLAITGNGTLRIETAEYAGCSVVGSGVLALDTGDKAVNMIGGIVANGLETASAARKNGHRKGPAPKGPVLRTLEDLLDPLAGVHKDRRVRCIKGGAKIRRCTASA